MSTLKVTNLQHPSAAAANVTLDSSGNAAFSGGITGVTSVNGGQLGARNAIINGAMQIAQRGSSTSGVTASGYYSCDRWKYESNGEQTVTIEQSTDAPSGFSNSLKLTVTTADADIAADYARFTQGIEGQNVQSFAYGTSDAKTITISFWVKSSVTGAYALTMQNLSADMLYVQTYTINSANTWEYKQLSITGDASNAITSSNAQGFRPLFFLSAGTTYSSTSSSGWTSNSASKQAYGQTANIIGTLNATWQITGVMLETGDTPTSYQHEDYGTTLQKCQRYYWRTSTIANSWYQLGSGVVYGTGTAYAVVRLPTDMRAVPSGGYIGTASDVQIISGGNTTTSTSSPTISEASPQSFRLDGSASGMTVGHGCFMRMANFASNAFYCDAEL